MPRRADIFCAGECGKLIWRGSTSLEAPICRDCRRSGAGRTAPKAGERDFRVTLVCQECANPYHPWPSGSGKYCSRSCAMRATRVHGSKRERQAAKCRRRRARKLAVPSEPYTLAEVAAEAEYICWLCDQDVDMMLPGSDLMGPTIDHVTPISQGGWDTRDNVSLAHRICNMLKGDGLRSVCVPADH
jgi:5-methylcytosine-specific restriction endonuclease McrA